MAKKGAKPAKTASNKAPVANEPLLGYIQAVTGGFKFWSMSHRCITFARTYEDCLGQAGMKGWRLHPDKISSSPI